MLRSFLLGLVGAVWFAGAALADGPINKTFFGNAMDGYDPVAYHLDGKAVEGSDDITFEWMEATWWFASEENRALFVADPEKYAPAYGGYCAYGISQGAKVGFDPDAWRIVDGVLYLNYSKSVQQRWEKDIPGHIELADQKWPELRNQ